MPIPGEIKGQKYISLTSFRRTGIPVATPVWFAEQDGKLWVMTRNDSGKYRRIRNNPQVRVAPCTIRGKAIGSEFDGSARVLPTESWAPARTAIRRKYWLARIPFLWSKQNVYLEIDISTSVSPNLQTARPGEERP
jgi:PPOX class probable F420-dependent enzyme